MFSLKMIPLLFFLGLALSLTSTAQANQDEFSYRDLSDLFASAAASTPSFDDFLLDSQPWAKAFSSKSPATAAYARVYSLGFEGDRYTDFFRADLSSEQIWSEFQRLVHEKKILALGVFASDASVRYSVIYNCSYHVRFRAVTLETGARMIVNRVTYSGQCNAPDAVVYSYYFPLQANDLVRAVAAADLYVNNRVVGHVEAGQEFRINRIDHHWANLVNLDGTAVDGWLKLANLAATSEPAPDQP